MKTGTVVRSNHGYLFVVVARVGRVFCGRRWGFQAEFANNGRQDRFAYSCPIANNAELPKVGDQVFIDIDELVQNNLGLMTRRWYVVPEDKRCRAAA